MNMDFNKYKVKYRKSLGFLENNSAINSVDPYAWV